MKKYICIHGHFYQPPRENPWLEEIEVQESAHPYHDWNERITQECYAPNCASRILSEDYRRVVKIYNNYANMSFNFGPTLLSWLERHAKNFYDRILEADRMSQKKFSGHGSALAQVYNHMIMPLANTQDERTQIYWGIRDFEHRFGRKPEGMWLAETAVNVETLELLAEYGIDFTILAPHQAKRIREIGADKWTDVQGSKIDPQRAYCCLLPSGRSINLFFYDGPVSQELAFQELLRDGGRYADRLTELFSEDDEEDRLVHVATDGETYGHHQNFGDMALAFCLNKIQEEDTAQITIYGEFLEKCPPQYEVEIVEDTSWSCVHGIERWKSNCGCCSGGHADWHQHWREPLRNSLDMLRNKVIPIYEHEMSAFCSDPWKARDEYIHVVLDRSTDSVDRFLSAYCRPNLEAAQKIHVLKLLEMQRYAMLMYTSCGWFFDEISGIETTQILKYASRVIQLTLETVGVDMEEEFVNSLRYASSNLPNVSDGADVYYQYVKPATVDMLRVGVHYAIDSVFSKHQESRDIYCYTATSLSHEMLEAGHQKLVIGQARIRSHITWEEEIVSYAVLHLGDHNLNGGVRPHMDDHAFGQMHMAIKAAFTESDIPAVIRLMNEHFDHNNYALRHLFKEEQKRIFDELVSSALDDIEAHFRQIYTYYYPLMQAQQQLQIPLPKALSTPVEFILNKDLAALLKSYEVKAQEIMKITEEIHKLNCPIDHAEISFIASNRINSMMNELRQNPRNQTLLEKLEIYVRLISPLNLNLNIWLAQDDYFSISQRVAADGPISGGDIGEPGEKWRKLFLSLGDHLNIDTGNGLTEELIGPIVDEAA